jgi:hypothetical protein
MNRKATPAQTDPSPAQQLLGSAASKTPTIRTLSAYAGHIDCPTATLAIAARADLDRMCTGTEYEPAVGQDPQAFQRERLSRRDSRRTATAR